MSKFATLYRMKMHDHICPYGIKSLDLLRRKGFNVDDQHLTSKAETERFKNEHKVETTPQTFINGVRIGGYTELKEYFGKDVSDEDATTYKPVIAIFSMTLLIAIAISLNNFGRIEPLWIVETFAALSMCVLAIQKLQDLSAFSLQFVTYDLIAMHYVRYAYAYAFLEAFAGVGMLGGFPAWLVAPPALIIGTVGAVSVFKAVYIDKRELKCACVGGNSKVPLGFVSLTENLIMIAMGIWMFIRVG